MRVVILNQFFYPDISATSQLMTQLAEDLAGCGLEVIALAGSSAYLGDRQFSLHEVHNGVRVIRLRTVQFDRSSSLKRMAAYLSFYCLSLLRLLLMPRPDVILVLTSPPLISLVACAVKLCRRCQVVYVIQDLYPQLAIELGVIRRRWPHSTLLNWLSVLSMKASDAIVVMGDCMRRRILHLGMPAEKVHTLTNWADGSAIRSVASDREEFRRRNDLQGKFVVMYSGNMGRAHDFRTVLLAAEGLAPAQEIVFLFAGEGARKPEVKRFAAEHSLQNIVLRPYAPQEQLGAALSAGDVALVTLAENLQGLLVPSKLYGIMASARPVIFIGPADSEPARTVLENGCGYVIANGDAQGVQDAVLKLWRNPALADEMGKLGRSAFEKHFDRQISTRRYYDLLMTGN